MLLRRYRAVDTLISLEAVDDERNSDVCKCLSAGAKTRDALERRSF